MNTTLHRASSLIDDAVKAAEPWAGDPKFGEVCDKLDRRVIRYSRNSVRRYGEPMMDAAAFVVGSLRSAEALIDEQDAHVIRVFEQLNVRMPTPEQKLAIQRADKRAVDIFALSQTLASTRLQLLAGY